MAIIAVAGVGSGPHNLQRIIVAPPVAGFSGTPTNLFITQSVVFTDASTGSITNWIWNFGDGHAVTNGSNVNMTNTYVSSLPSPYTVTLAVAGAGGTSTNTQHGLHLRETQAGDQQHRAVGQQPDLERDQRRAIGVLSDAVCDEPDVRALDAGLDKCVCGGRKL